MKFGSTHYSVMTSPILECRTILNVLRLNIRIILTIQTRMKLGGSAKILTSSDITMLWTAVSLGPAMIRLDVSYEAKRNLYTAAVRRAPSPGGFHRRRREDT